MSLKIKLQPKQGIVMDWLESSKATWIGMGGGRGAAKSGGADRIALGLSVAQPGIVSCIVMRNYDQVRKYHIEPTIRTWPELEGMFTVSTSKLRIPTGGKFSEIDYSYAESLTEVERRFRSANYKYIIVDQAEQFSEAELLEMHNACRWPGGGAKMLLLFNMGGASIQTLARWFHRKEYNDRQDPEDYLFMHVYPWDNVEWSRTALEQDGLTESDYYFRFNDAQRQEYCAIRSEYGKSLNSLDDAIRNRDWLSSWDSLEGAFFGRVFDLGSVRVDPSQARQLAKTWDTRWMSQDWGKAHYCVTYWHTKSVIGPTDAKSILGWDCTKPLTVVCTYRELVLNEMSSKDVAGRMIDVTPPAERNQIVRYFLSPDAFGERDSPETIAITQGNYLTQAGMPHPYPADNDVVGGWQLMYDLLNETKRHGEQDGLVWVISSDCPHLLESIPVLMRDPKDLDRVLKTDKGQTKLEQDSSESARYGLKSMLSPNKMPEEEKLRAKIAAADALTAHYIRFAETIKRKEKQVDRGYWE